MTESEFAIELPRSAAEHIAAEMQAPDVRVDVKDVARGEGALRFDPAMTAEMASWLVVKVGQHAPEIALALVSNFLYDALKSLFGSHPKAEKKEVTIRYKDGTVVTMPVDRAIDAKFIEEFIATRGRKKR